MRIALVLSLLIAILAVVFALQNPAYIDVNIGPYDITHSTALILMVTFCVGVVVGILATVPSIFKRRKRVRELERHAVDTRVEEQKRQSTSEQPSTRSSATEQPPTGPTGTTPSRRSIDS